MIKKTITFEDFNGETQTEDHYFHLSRAELMRLEISGEGNSLSEHMKRIGAKRSGKDIMDAFDHLISQSYGERSIDGSRFDKHPDILRRFKSSEAFSVLFLEVTTEADKSAEFWNGLVPADVLADIQKEGRNKPQAGNDPQTARERSQASLQGYKKPEQKREDIVVQEAVAYTEPEETGKTKDEIIREAHPRAKYEALSDSEYEELIRFKGLAQQ